jgi:tetratricopeptide (TPR) repeat protein
VTCIKIYESLLAESNSLAGADACSPFNLQPECNGELHRPCTRRYHVLIHLAYALRERYSYTGDESDLEAAIAHGQAALVLCSTGSALCPTVLVIHASLLVKNAQRTGDYGQIHTAESMCRQALTLCTNACTVNATAYHTLGWIMLRLYEIVGAPAYLDEAFNLQQRALNCASRGVEDYQCLRALAVCAIERHMRLRDPQDIDSSMLFVEQALELCPVLHIDRMLIVESMIHAAHHKYFLSGRLEDANRAIDIGRKTMTAPNFPHGYRRLAVWTALANLLLARYEVASSADCDLEEAVNLRREVFRCVSPSFMYRWTYTENLALALEYRFMRKGELQDLEESIGLYRNAIDLLPEGHPERPKIFSNLGNALCHRFHETWNTADLDEALVSGRYAMAGTSPSRMHYWTASLATISHLCIRFELFKAVDDLDQAVLLSESLLKTIPDGHIQREDAARHLAKALLLRGAHMKVIEDVDRAIREVVPFRQKLAQSAAAPEVSRTLATSYLVRFRLKQYSCDAAHALDITNDLLDVVGPSHYERFKCLVHAAELYSERGAPFRDIAIALKHIAEAMLNNCRDVRSKIQGAKTFLDIVKAQYKEVWTTASPAISAKLLDIYKLIIGFLPRIAFFGLHLYSRLQSLAIGQSIALDGASHALNISLPERALEILEQGRVIFWNHTLRLRSPFDDVPDEFRDRLAYLARQLEKSSDIFPDAQDSQTIEKEAARRRQQSEEFNTLVDRVRCLPGMERFLLHDEYATLAKAADRGPVVVLVPSTLACYAIVVKSADEVISIPLVSITESWLDESGNAWRMEVIKARSAVRDSRKMVKTGKSSKSMRTKADDILERLWTGVVYPVLSNLGLEVCCFPSLRIWVMVVY